MTTSVTPEVRKTSPAIQVGSSRGQKERENLPRISDVKLSTGLCTGIHLAKKMRAHMGRVLGQVRC